VTRAEMDVRGMEQSEHPGAIGLLSRRRARSDEARCRPVAERPSAAPDWRERGAPWPSLATPNLAGHCDRSDVTVPSLVGRADGPVAVTPSFLMGGILPNQ
jgi:hypothetical protein